MDRSEYKRRQRISNSRRKNRKRRKMIRIAKIAGLAVAAILIIVLLFLGVKKLIGMIGSGGSDGKDNDSGQVTQEETEEQIRAKKIEEAKYLALTYDYDAAIEILKGIKDYEVLQDVQDLITEIEAEKASCVPVKMEEVTHIFYHSLIVDTDRAFANHDTDNQAVGNNQWMTTIDEFNKITQEMYDRGYVLVSIHDLIATDEAGNLTYTPGTILLPEGKKAFVLSIDDVSYYHAYDGYGYATKLVIDENGDVMNEYTDAAGNTTIGAYDVVPLLDQFIEEHPDASYRGAKGIIALTGYNGVLGYRTDETYDYNNPDCDIHQKAWMDAHPDFTLENERAEAKKVADAMKENGWEFGSHTWGHLRVGSRSLESLQKDNEKWQRNIVPIVGEVDTIIFAHGEDLSGQGDYPTGNAKFQYFYNEGYRIFCNVDSNKYTTHFGPNYMRQGRRNLDGYRLYRNVTGAENNLSDLFDAKEILDPARPAVKPLG